MSKYKEGEKIYDLKYDEIYSYKESRDKFVITREPDRFKRVEDIKGQQT